MQSGRSGMGSHKHGVSGKSPKSPKLRVWLRLEAEKKEKKHRLVKMCGSMKELMKK